jgi:hypothetical protein
MIDETGWPGAGARLGGAERSFENAILCANIDVLLSLFDEEWESCHEGDRALGCGTRAGSSSMAREALRPCP